MRNAWLVVALIGCAQDGGSEPDLKIREARAPAARPTSINALAPYERLVANVETCAFEGNELVSTCPALRALDSELAGVSSAIRKKVGASMITHASPAVRVQAATMVDAGVIERAAKREQDPRVLGAFLRIAPAIAPIAAEHPDAGVRLAAVPRLTTAAKLVALAESDADPRVRRAACEHAGTLGTDEVLPLYERTTATAADPQHYAACMAGLAAMFHRHPSFETASEPAYRLFLRRLAQTPRSEHVPPWQVTSTFCYFTHEADLDKLAAWKQRATWFDAAEVKRVLASVIADRAANMQARSAAVESLVGLGATDAELAALARTVDKPLADKLTERRAR